MEGHVVAKKKPRRSSILKKALVDLNSGCEDREKRRVSFKPSIMVKEFHKGDNQNAQPQLDYSGGQSDKEGSLTTKRQSDSDIYMIPANNSFYQMSTPVGDKRRRLSETAVSRLSIIPTLDKSFNGDDTPSDFECFEDSSETTAPKEAITMPENTNQLQTLTGNLKDASLKEFSPSNDMAAHIDSFDLSCMDHASVAGPAVPMVCPSFDAGSITSAFPDHNDTSRCEAQPNEQEMTMCGDSMELTLLEDEPWPVDSVCSQVKPPTVQPPAHFVSSTSAPPSNQHALPELLPLEPNRRETENDGDNEPSSGGAGLAATHPPPTAPVSSTATCPLLSSFHSCPQVDAGCKTVYDNTGMSMTSMDASHISLGNEDTKQNITNTIPKPAEVSHSVNVEPQSLAGVHTLPTISCPVVSQERPSANNTLPPLPTTNFSTLSQTKTMDTAPPSLPRPSPPPPSSPPHNSNLQSKAPEDYHTIYDNVEMPFPLSSSFHSCPQVGAGCNTAYEDVDMSMTSIDASHISLGNEDTKQDVTNTILKPAEVSHSVNVEPQLSADVLETVRTLPTTSCPVVSQERSSTNSTLHPLPTTSFPTLSQTKTLGTLPLSSSFHSCPQVDAGCNTVYDNTDMSMTSMDASHISLGNEDTKQDVTNTIPKPAEVSHSVNVEQQSSAGVHTLPTTSCHVVSQERPSANNTLHPLPNTSFPTLSQTKTVGTLPLSSSFHSYPQVDAGCNTAYEDVGMSMTSMDASHISLGNEDTKQDITNVVPKPVQVSHSVNVEPRSSADVHTLPTTSCPVVSQERSSANSTLHPLPTTSFSTLSQTKTVGTVPPPPSLPPSCNSNLQSKAPEDYHTIYDNVEMSMTTIENSQTCQDSCSERGLFTMGPAVASNVTEYGGTMILTTVATPTKLNPESILSTTCEKMQHDNEEYQPQSLLHSPATESVLATSTVAAGTTTAATAATTAAATTAAATAATTAVAAAPSYQISLVPIPQVHQSVPVSGELKLSEQPCTAADNNQPPSGSKQPASQTLPSSMSEMPQLSTGVPANNRPPSSATFETIPAITLPANIALPAKPQTRPVPPVPSASLGVGGFKRPRQILPDSVVSKRLAFGKTHPAPHTPTLSAIHTQRMPAGRYPPLRSPGVTLSLLKTKIKHKGSTKPLPASCEPPPPAPSLHSTSQPPLPAAVVSVNSQPPPTAAVVSVNSQPPPTAAAVSINSQPPLPATAVSVNSQPPAHTAANSILSSASKPVIFTLASASSQRPTPVHQGRSGSSRLLNATHTIEHTHTMPYLMNTYTINTPRSSISSVPPVLANATSVHEDDDQDDSRNQSIQMPNTEEGDNDWLTNPDNQSLSLLEISTDTSSSVSPPDAVGQVFSATVQSPSPVLLPVSPLVHARTAPTTRVMSSVPVLPVVPSTATSSSSTLSTKLSALKIAHNISKSQPPVINTPELIVPDSNAHNEAIPPISFAFSTTLDQSVLDPVLTGAGGDKSIRVISPLTLGKFAALAGADKSLNLEAEYAQQLLQQESDMDADTASPQLVHSQQQECVETTEQLEVVEKETTVDQENKAVATLAEEKDETAVDAELCTQETELQLPAQDTMLQQTSQETEVQQQHGQETALQQQPQEETGGQQLIEEIVLQPLVHEDKEHTCPQMTTEQMVGESYKVDEKSFVEQRVVESYKVDEKSSFEQMVVESDKVDEKPSVEEMEMHNAQPMEIQPDQSYREEVVENEQDPCKEEHQNQQQHIGVLVPEAFSSALNSSVGELPIVPLVQCPEQDRYLTDLLDELYQRFKSLHSATAMRVLSNYFSNHKAFRVKLEQCFKILHCCVCMVRCLIDYVRLTDVPQLPCFIQLSPSLLPEGVEDIKGNFPVQEKWIHALYKTTNPLYEACHKAMFILYRHSGWIIDCWSADEVCIFFGEKGEKLQFKFVLDTSQLKDKPDKVKCQKVTDIVTMKAVGCSVPRGLKCSSVLDIPVALQTVCSAI